MGDRLQMLKDMGINLYGLGENVASLGSAAIAEPVAGFAAMYDPVNGAQAIREGMTYQPRSEAAKMYQRGAANVIGQAVKPVMPVVETWQKGVDIAGSYSPAAGAALQTTPTALASLLGYKPAMQTGRQVSNSLDMLQRRVVANANTPSTLNTAGFRGQRGVFAGINALTADKEALAKAQQMIAQGADPADVWEETGWGAGVDGKWRFEIDDSNALIKPNELLKNRNMNQGDLLEHDQLYAAYPDLKKIDVGVIDAGAAYDMSNGNIKLGYDSLSSGDLDWPKTTNLHELQHAIQQRERFALGGGNESAINFVKEQIALNNKKIETLKRINPNDERILKYEQEIKRLTPNLYSTNDAYKRLAGEVEARMVETRGYLSKKKRLETYPFEKFGEGTYSVEPEQQLIRKTWKDKSDAKALSQRPLTEFEQAHQLAQRNAALPVSQGGLGLAPDNTAMDRARAMGFKGEGVHYTPNDFDAFREGKGDYSAVWVTTDPKVNLAAHNIGHNGEMIEGTNGMPLLFNNQKRVTATDKWDNDITSNFPDNVSELDAQKLKALGFTHGAMGTQAAILDPKNIRSRFAAFDPFNRESSNLLAQSAKFAPTAGISAYLYNQQEKDKQ